MFGLLDLARASIKTDLFLFLKSYFLLASILLQTLSSPSVTGTGSLSAGCPRLPPQQPISYGKPKMAPVYPLGEKGEEVYFPKQ